jgi:hypothetical protein
LNWLGRCISTRQITLWLLSNPFEWFGPTKLDWCVAMLNWWSIRSRSSRLYRSVSLKEKAAESHIRTRERYFTEAGTFNRERWADRVGSFREDNWWADMGWWYAKNMENQSLISSFTSAWLYAWLSFLDGRQAAFFLSKHIFVFHPSNQSVHSWLKSRFNGKAMYSSMVGSTRRITAQFDLELLRLFIIKQLESD